MKLKSLLSIVTFLGILFLFSCAKKHEANERVLNLVANAETKGFDPIMASDMASASQISKIYEGLLAYHWLKVPYELIPNLADSMPVASKDGLTYTIKIKKGVFFQNDIAFPSGKGREIEASDFVYSIKRLADSKNQSTGWWVLDGKIKGLNEWRNKNEKLPVTNYDEEIEGVKALDKYTLQFKLAKVFPQFLYALAMPFTFVVSKEVVEKYGKEFINHPVGTGPYVLPKFDQGKRIAYTKNPTFREKLYPSDASPQFKHLLADAGKRLPLVDKIVVNIMVESQPAWLKFNKGEVDYYYVPKDNFATSIKDNKLSPEMLEKGIELIIAPQLAVYFTAFNFDFKLFQNVNLRKAMLLAIDGKKENELFYNNTAYHSQSVVPPGIAGNNKDYKNPSKGQNLDLAKKTLALAGYPNGKGLPEIIFDTVDSTTSRQYAEFFQKQMELIGIKIKIQSNPWPEMQAKMKKRSVQMFTTGWFADYPDTENFLQLFYGPNSSPGANSSNYNNPVFNKKFEEAVSMQDSPARTKLYEKLNEYLGDEAVALFSVHPQGYTVKHGWIKNYRDSDLHYDSHQYLNIDMNKKEELLKKL